jgi:PKD repeat protein
LAAIVLLVLILLSGRMAPAETLAGTPIANQVLLRWDGGVVVSNPVHCQVTGLAGLMADFTADVTDGPTPLVAQFTDLSIGNPTSWSWDFGDGSASTDQNPIYVYTMPGVYGVTLTASDQVETAAEVKPKYIVAGFSDVPADYWDYQEIMGCLSDDMLHGYPDGTFRPLDAVTRDQIAVYLARAVAGGEDLVPKGPAQPTFRDVPTDYWAYDAIEYVYQLRIIFGYPYGVYRPKRQVNRADMAVFLARAVAGQAGLQDYTPPTTPTFPDVTPSSSWAWCYRYVEYIASRDIASGYPDGLYHPERICTRDQLAAYLSRAFRLRL